MADDDNILSEPFQVDGRYNQDIDRNGDRVPDRMQQGYDSATGEPLASDYPPPTRLGLNHIDNTPDERSHRETLAIIGSTYDNARGMSRDHDARAAADEAVAGSSAVEKEAGSKPKRPPNFHERETARKLWERRKDMPKKEAGLLKNLRHIQSGDKDGKTGIEVLQSLGHGIGAGLMIGWRQAERQAEINLYKENEEFHLELARTKDADAAKEANDAAKQILGVSEGHATSGDDRGPGGSGGTDGGPDTPPSGNGPENPDRGPQGPIVETAERNTDQSGPSATPPQAQNRDVGRDPSEARTSSRDATVRAEGGPPEASTLRSGQDGVERDPASRTVASLEDDRASEPAPVQSVREGASSSVGETTDTARDHRSAPEQARTPEAVATPRFEPQPTERGAQPDRTGPLAAAAGKGRVVDDGGVKPIQQQQARTGLLGKEKTAPPAVPSQGRSVDPSTANANMAAGMAVSTVAPMAAPVLTAGATHSSQKEIGADHSTQAGAPSTGAKGPNRSVAANPQVSVTYGKAGSPGERRLAPAPAIGPRQPVAQGPDQGEHRRGGMHQLASTLASVERPTLSKGPSTLGTRRPGAGIGMVVAARIIQQRSGPDQSVLENMRDNKSVTR